MLDDQPIRKREGLIASNDSNSKYLAGSSTGNDDFTRFKPIARASGRANRLCFLRKTSMRNSICFSVSGWVSRTENSATVCPLMVNRKFGAAARLVTSAHPFHRPAGRALISSARTLTFAGFRSRGITPCSWAASSAWRSGRRSAIPSSRARGRASGAPRDPPLLRAPSQAQARSGWRQPHQLRARGCAGCSDDSGTPMSSPRAHSGQTLRVRRKDIVTIADASYSALIATMGCTAAARRADGMPASTATTNAVAAASA
jgi:hypothetical protein